MKIEFWYLGKTRESYVLKGMEVYEKNIKRYCSYSSRTLPAATGYQKTDIKAYQSKEAHTILRSLDPADHLVLLDEAGKHTNSRGFALWLQKTIDRSPRRLVFLIGGAYGFSQEIYDRANDQISLSKMTFPHQLVRVLFLEQLYRAFTIINNQSYHH